MQVLKLPKAGQAMEESDIVEWLVDEGKAVSEGDPVVLFETDKMTSEIAADQDGHLLRKEVSEGETVSIGTVLGYIGTDESELPEEAATEMSTGNTNAGATRDRSESTPPSQVRGSPKARRIAREHDVDVTKVGQALDVEQVREIHIEEYLKERNGASSTDSEILASPLAKRIARENDVEVAAVGNHVGTDRVRKADVDVYLESKVKGEPTLTRSESASKAEPTGRTVTEEIPIQGARSVMFDRMSEVAREYASTTTVAQVDVTKLWDRYQQLSNSWSEVHDVKPSPTAFVVRAVTDSLPEYRILNAELIDTESVTVYESINVGLAVNTNDGLRVPTIYDADERSVRELSREIRRLASAAEEGALEFDEMQNGTFTVSNAGNLGAYINTPQIFPPQTAILGVCTVSDEPGIVDGEVVPRKKMHLCLTYDHRVIEGATAVAFLQSVKALLEEPDALLS